MEQTRLVLLQEDLDKRERSDGEDGEVPASHPLLPSPPPPHTLSSAVAVLERMLLLDPENRVTASEALTLPYFAEFRDPEEEKEAQPYDHSLDNTDLPLSQWKRKRSSWFWCEEWIIVTVSHTFVF